MLGASLVHGRHSTISSCVTKSQWRLTETSSLSSSVRDGCSGILPGFLVLGGCTRLKQLPLL